MSTPLYQNSQKLYLPLTQDLHKPRVSSQEHGWDINYSTSVPGQTAGELRDLPSEEERPAWSRTNFQPGAGLHGESVQLRGGQKDLPGLVSHGELWDFTVVALRVHPSLQNLSVPSLRFVSASISTHSVNYDQLCTYHAYFLRQDIFWAVYIGERCLLKCFLASVISSTLHLLNDHLSVFRRRPVRRESLQEWSHVFR